MVIFQIIYRHLGSLDPFRLENLLKTETIHFVGDSFTNLCNHNAGVASRLGMFHTAETWRMLVALYSTALSYEEAGRMASKAAAARKAITSNGANVDAAGGDSDTDADHDESEIVLESRWVRVDISWADLISFNLLKTSCISISLSGDAPVTVRRPRGRGGHRAAPGRPPASARMLPRPQQMRRLRWRRPATRPLQQRPCRSVAVEARPPRRERTLLPCTARKTVPRVNLRRWNLVSRRQCTVGVKVAFSTIVRIFYLRKQLLQ